METNNITCECIDYKLNCEKLLIIELSDNWYLMFNKYYESWE